MPQDNLIKLESEGNTDGHGKGHIRFTHKNKKKLKERLRLRKYNPIINDQTWYKETK
ncbi:MAG: 50S ribosomal protein L33 [Candidatus Magasanikbacteria bacterium]|uniref:Large ribosomal subunit protein bL33 n=1 Tax=Candidatus Magasanikbacteria bacterium CG10_big_fil_rev_8_21_14_0_10_38_6 TaxID=1974647 RepID=A0A2M6P1Y9_9BACT|nr:50S ribosomal protein L33 [Candidatus Magasanikbacteria bacterium]NCS72189.1 50S ribosomal protein L33 [Candidatus Magasanikbacteria bacterium]PIR77704.1 MAG: 50S ribosomal protein L33 [Candidatus Magasanikbacteria bacterium CG10_big_fil_rev_8_21_14_0_10_38_6]